MVAFHNPAIFMPAKRPPVPATRPFELASHYQPAGDQPQAIAELIEGVERGERDQVLLGVTGSGKTFTIANVIADVQRPTLMLAPNKILAAQLYGEMKGFFPENAVEYFVSYYDYYQPEAYVPRTDTYIAKDSSINEQIDRMRHSATRALLERNDVIIVASVSCIYGIGAARPTRDGAEPQRGPADRAQGAAAAGWSSCSTSATTSPSPAASSGRRATSSRSFRRTWRTGPGGCRCSATRSRRSGRSIR